MKREINHVFNLTRSRTLPTSLSLSLLLAVLLPGSILASEAKTLNRDIEEVIVFGADLNDFLGQPTDRIHLYRYDSASAAFEPVPFQIDRKKTEQLARNCMSDPPVDNCEINFAFDDNGDPEAGVLGGDDEVVFLARDSGPEAPNNIVWNPGAVSNTRYEIRVNDVRLVDEVPVINGSGWVYAFLFLEPHAFELSDPFYVDWEPRPDADADRPDQDCVTGDPNITRGPKSCGLFKAIPSAMPGESTYRMRYLGHWVINRLWLDPPGGASPDGEVLDRMKWRAYGQARQNEENWSDGGACPRFLGLKRGPVRILYYAQGSASGPNTTRTDRLYATHWRSMVKLRVHDGVDKIIHYFDLLKSDSNGTIDVSSGDPANAEDVIDGLAPGQSFGQWEDWTRIVTSSGSFVTFFKETRPFNSGPVHYHYEDLKTTKHAPEFEMGAYGNFGEYWSGPTTDFQDKVCAEDPDDPRLLYRQMDFTTFIGDPNNDDEAATFAFWTSNPLRYEVDDQTRNSSPPPPPDPPAPPDCPPLWMNPANPENGRYLDVAVNVDDCTESTPSWLLYRALGSGAFAYHAKLAPGETYRDWQVYRGQTYRYQARAANSDGVEGPASTIVSLTAVDNDPPDPPPALQISAWNEAVSVDWDKATNWDVRGYNLYLATSPGGPYNKANNDPIVPASFTATGLQNGTPYYVVIRTVDWGGNESADSVELSAVPGP